jgi:hypothetical protein
MERHDPMPEHPHEPSSSMRCCCGRTDCVLLKKNSSILENVEKDVHTAAQLGQVGACDHFFFFFSFSLFKHSSHSWCFVIAVLFFETAINPSLMTWAVMSCDEPFSTLLHYRTYQSPLFVVCCCFKPHVFHFYLGGYAEKDGFSLLTFTDDIRSKK